MALKRKPVTGMKDILPGEMEIRDYVISLIKETYRTFGFSSIETPCVEHIENLCSKQGKRTSGRNPQCGFDHRRRFYDRRNGIRGTEQCKQTEK